MSSRKQRMKNRLTSRWLNDQVVTYPECRERGRHWVQWPASLEDLFGGGRAPHGFWTCAKFYGPDGRRIDA